MHRLIQTATRTEMNSYPAAVRGRRGGSIDLLCWLVVAFAGCIMLTQAFGWAGTRLIAVAQSLTPYLPIGLVPVIAVAIWRRALLVVTTATAVGLAIVILAAPLAFPDPQPLAASDATGLRVVAMNLWYQNPRIDDVDDVLTDVDADVIVLNEYTPSHQSTLLATDLADRYEYRIDRGGRGATGVALWSKWPIRLGPSLDTFNDSLDVTIAGPDADVRVVAMHMPTPIVDFDAWRADLATGARIGRSTEVPTLLIGDLNASYWHPDFRSLLDAGFVDANAAAGSGFSTSWPTDWWIPPFVRLDHALTTGGLVSTDVDDVDVPGSDHRGLIVTVAPAR
jgi:endonuclease/exonuclease/phosphatase (EEP) superfamily protein YafD